MNIFFLKGLRRVVVHMWDYPVLYLIECECSWLKSELRQDRQCLFVCVLPDGDACLTAAIC